EIVAALLLREPPAAPRVVAAAALRELLGELERIEVDRLVVRIGEFHAPREDAVGHEDAGRARAACRAQRGARARHLVRVGRRPAGHPWRRALEAAIRPVERATESSALEGLVED